MESFALFNPKYKLCFLSFPIFVRIQSPFGQTCVPNTWNATIQLGLFSPLCFLLWFTCHQKEPKASSLPASDRSCGRRPVGVAQHGVEGAGEVVGAGAAGHVLRQRDQTRQQEEEEQEELQREGGAEHPIEEGARRWGVLLSAGGARREWEKV